MPRGTASQGIYELADGTHVGTACCWDFGNVTTDPTKYGVMNTLFFGNAFWGKGAGAGPWFMADFEAGVWAGGSKKGDPGWGALDEAASGEHEEPVAEGEVRVRDPEDLDQQVGAANGRRVTDYGGLPPRTKARCPRRWTTSAGSCWASAVTTATTRGAPSTKAPSSRATRRPTVDDAVLANVKAAGYGK